MKYEPGYGQVKEVKDKEIAQQQTKEKENMWSGDLEVLWKEEWCKTIFSKKAGGKSKQKKIRRRMSNRKKEIEMIRKILLVEKAGGEIRKGRIGNASHGIIGSRSF